MTNIYKLDYSLEDPQDRVKLVEKILEEYPDPNERYLEALASYLILAMEKKERREKKILTENRLATINKRETSFEGLVAQFEYGEDNVYNLMTNDKHQIFKPKVSITADDVASMPFLAQLREAIDVWEKAAKQAKGLELYMIKKSLIEMRKDQYLIKSSYKPTTGPARLIRTSYTPSFEDETHRLTKYKRPIPEGFSLISSKICSLILCNYSELKAAGFERIDSDLYFLMLAFDELMEAALEPNEIYKEITIAKIDGLSNLEIQNLIYKKFNIKHSLEYISSLWRRRIPKLIADKAEEQWLDWYYLVVENGQYKQCTRCGEIKLAHGRYFSRNRTSKDGFYSICKECRNAAFKQNKNKKKEVNKGGSR